MTRHRSLHWRENAATYSANINVRTIRVGDRLRKLDQDKVNELAESIAQSGLLQPIVVTPNKASGRGYVLVAGVHRFEAVKQLGHKNIKAEVIKNIDADHALLAEIDENLIRAELTPAGRAQHVDARKTIWEKLHPETKHGGSPGKAGGGKKAKDAKSASFVEDTAKKTGQSKRKVASDAARGKKVAVLPDIVGTSLDKGTELDALAALPIEKQRDLAKRAKAGEQVSAVELDAERKRIEAAANPDTESSAEARKALIAAQEAAADDEPPASPQDAAPKAVNADATPPAKPELVKPSPQRIFAEPFTTYVLGLKALATKRGEHFVDEVSSDDLETVAQFLSHVASLQRSPPPKAPEIVDAGKEVAGAPNVDDDLSVPTFLRRAPQTDPTFDENAKAAVSGTRKNLH